MLTRLLAKIQLEFSWPLKNAILFLLHSCLFLVPFVSNFFALNVEQFEE